MAGLCSRHRAALSAFLLTALLLALRVLFTTPPQHSSQPPLPLTPPARSRSWNGSRDQAASSGPSPPTQAKDVSKKETVRAASTYLIPNLVHFVRVTGRQTALDFTEMMSIKSAFKMQRPDAMYMHCDYPPDGQWWTDLTSELQIKVIQRSIPTHIGNIHLNSMSLACDAIKLDILKEYGGVVMETDVIIIQSLDPLRHYNFSIGQEKSPRLSTGIILANKNSAFLHILLNSLNSSNPLLSLTTPDIGRRAYGVWQQQRPLVHVEEEALSSPDWVHRYLLFSDNDFFRWWRRKLYVVHFMFEKQEGAVYNPEYIKTLKNLVGSVLRYICFGSPDLVDNYLPHVLYAASKAPPGHPANSCPRV